LEHPVNGRRARLAAALTMLVLAACGTTTTPAATAPPIDLPATANKPSSTVTVIATQPLPAITATARSTSTATAEPSATRPVGPAVRQLTSGGCCVQPFWSADGSQVRYIDRPSSGQPSGIWGVNLSGGAPTFVTARLGIYSPNETLVAYPESSQTYIERVGGERWVVANGGRAVIFSPDSRSIAWQVANSPVNFDTRQVVIWVASVDGSGAHKVATLAGGGLAGWFPDSQRLLVTSRMANATQVQALNLADGSLTLIAAGARIQGLSLSPLGGWAVFGIAFSGDASIDGLWMAPTTGGPARRLADYGACAWRAEGRLLLIPLEATARSNRLIEVAAVSGKQRMLTDPALTPFQIADGNWSLSPDGSHLAFVSSADHNIWVMDLPE
jgi:Tol biopolymer transport system component